MAVAMVLGGAVAARAQLGAEIAQRHAQRAGERLARVQTLYTEGRTFIGSETVAFKTWSERPDRLRVESYGGPRRVVQCFDGAHEPWISHSAVDDGRAKLMTEADARDFIGNADFDGPLVDFAAKGNTVDYAGEDPVDGRPAYKLLVMNARDEVFFYWVDKDNLEVVKRVAFRAVRGRRVALETYFRDYKPVAGVLQPHRIESLVEGKSAYVMVIDKIEANSRRFPADIFDAPKDWPDYRKPKPKTAADTPASINGTGESVGPSG